jgi:hypothetical protein
VVIGILDYSKRFKVKNCTKVNAKLEKSVSFFRKINEKYYQFPQNGLYIPEK